MNKILRIDEVVRVTGVPRSTLYEMIGRGEFPKQIRLTPRATGWVEAEVQDWLSQRIEQRDGLRKTEAA